MLAGGLAEVKGGGRDTEASTREPIKEKTTELENYSNKDGQRLMRYMYYSTPIYQNTKSTIVFS